MNKLLINNNFLLKFQWKLTKLPFNFVHFSGFFQNIMKLMNKWVINRNFYRNFSQYWRNCQRFRSNFVISRDSATFFRILSVRNWNSLKLSWKLVISTWISTSSLIRIDSLCRFRWNWMELGRESPDNSFTSREWNVKIRWISVAFQDGNGICRRSSRLSDVATSHRPPIIFLACNFYY